MEFKDISYIIAICEHKNISQAARSLFISQPALSQQLQKIEAKLGKPLFVRSGHTMMPTAACRIITEQGHKLLAEREMMLRAVKQLQESSEEKISFGMSPFYARHLLPGIMQYMHKNSPQHTLTFADRGNSVAQEQAVLEGKLDCCLMPMHPANPDLEYLPVGLEEIFLAVPYDHPLANLNPPDNAIDIALTKDEPYILHRDIDKIAALQDKLFADAGFTPHAVHTATGWDMIISFVRCGMGLSLITELIIDDYRLENPPRYYHIRNMDMSRPFALGYRRGSVLTPAMEMLLEASRQEFALQKARIKK